MKGYWPSGIKFKTKSGFCLNEFISTSNIVVTRSAHFSLLSSLMIISSSSFQAIKSSRHGFENIFKKNSKCTIVRHVLPVINEREITDQVLFQTKPYNMYEDLQQVSV